jgi:hypothetical protein
MLMGEAAPAAPVHASMAESRRLAVLIDADNTSPKIADALFEEVAKIGEASLRRIYGDFSGSKLKSWADILARHAILPQQQFAYTVGKNSSDIALVIDAMDLLHSARFDGFCPGLVGQRLHPARGPDPRAGGGRLRHRPGQDPRELPPGLHPLHLHRELRTRPGHSEGGARLAAPDEGGGRPDPQGDGRARGGWRGLVPARHRRHPADQPLLGIRHPHLRTPQALGPRRRERPLRHRPLRPAPAHPPEFVHRMCMGSASPNPR